MTNWVGAGLVGLIVFVSGDLGREILGTVHPFIGSLLLTLLTLSGGALALARVKFEFAVARIKNREADGIFQYDTAELPEDFRAGKAAGFFWLSSITLIFLAGITFLVAVWWWFSIGISENSLH